MLGTLALHYVKSVLRAPRWSSKSILVNIVLGVFVLYLALNLVVVGLFLHTVLLAVLPVEPPLRVVQAYLLPAFLSLLGFRLLLQQSPDLRIQPYLHLPIPRSKLVHFFQLASLADFQNLYPLLFFVPYWLANIAPAFPAPQAACWLLGILCVIGMSHYITLLLRARYGRRPGLYLAFVGSFVGLSVLDYTVIDSDVVEHVSLALFAPLTTEKGPLLLGSLVLFLAASYLASYQESLRTLRPAPARVGPAGTSAVWHRLAFLERYGLSGRLLSLELRLIARNLRTKQMVASSLLFVPMGLLYVAIESFQEQPFIAAIGLFLLSGAGIVNYGQFLFSWESRYYDGLLTWALPLQTLVQSKIVVLQLACTVLYLLTLPPVAWLEPRLLAHHSALAFYNAGLMAPLLVWMSTFNTKRIDLRDSSVMNFQGASLHHFVAVVPIMLAPAAGIGLLGFTSTSALLLGGAGLASGLALPLWSRMLAARLHRSKYDMAAGFRR